MTHLYGWTSLLCAFHYHINMLSKQKGLFLLQQVLWTNSYLSYSWQAMQPSSLSLGIYIGQLGVWLKWNDHQLEGEKRKKKKKTAEFCSARMGGVVSLGYGSKNSNFSFKVGKLYLARCFFVSHIWKPKNKPYHWVRLKICWSYQTEI